MKIAKILVAIGLLYFVFFGSVPDININPLPDEVDEVEALLNVDEPSEAVLQTVKPVADLITETEDRAKLALFNYEFASRITRYNTDAQQLNDVYTTAAANFFDEKFKGKYDGLSEGLTNLLRSVTTDDNHVLTTDEKQRLKDLFNGLSWALIER